MSVNSGIVLKLLREGERADANLVAASQVSVLDYFAAAALTGRLSSGELTAGIEGAVAADCYRLAVAMMRARSIAWGRE